VPGIDLPALDAALRIGGRRAKKLVAAALGSGQSAGLAGSFALTIADGKASLAGATWQGQAGSIGAAGSIGLRNGLLDGTLTVRPAIASAPFLVVVKDGRRQADAPEHPSHKTRRGGPSRPPRPPARF
jgi:hypothetical protein